VNSIVVISIAMIRNVQTARTQRIRPMPNTARVAQ